MKKMLFKRITLFTDFLENLFNLLPILLTMIRIKSFIIDNGMNFLHENETSMPTPLITVTSYELKLNSMIKLNQNTEKMVIL